MSDFESGSTSTFPAPGAGSRMVVGDFDGDGDADILYQTVGNGTPFQYARSNGDGTFTILALAASPFSGLTLPDNSGGTHYAGDFDGDGDIDLWAATASATGTFLRNNGTTFSVASSATFPAPTAATRVATGDFDGDGDADILYQTVGNGTAFQYARSNGDGTFTILAQASSPLAGVTLLDHNGSNYLAADFDGDGDTDLIATPNSSQGEYYRNDNGTFAEGSTATFPLPAAGGRMTAGDFDADGDADILYQTGANGTVFQYARSNGDGTFSILSLTDSPFSGLTLPDHGGANYYAADFDGDGDTDLLAGVNGTTGSYFYQVGKPPELVSSTPADNATGVAVGASVQVVFDEAVSKGSGNIYLYRGDGVLIEAISVNSAQVTGSGTTWTIDPSVTLSGLTNYYVLLDAGTFRDADNAEFTGIDDITTLNFTTASANTAPVQANNLGLTLNEGASGTITAARLDFNDAQQADTAITYTVTTLATNGTLRLNGVALGLGGTFTQSDINNSLVTYLHDGGETTGAAFGFSVSDGAGGSVTGQSFAFTVTPLNDAPTHGLPATVFTAEETEVPLNNGVAIDPTPSWIADVDSATITTTLTAADGSFAATAFGGALVSGAGTNSMTVTGSVADVNKTVYFASYTPALNVYGNRTLTVLTSDGSGWVSNTISVVITGTNDAPEGSDLMPATSEDTAYVLSAADFGFSDPDGHGLASVLVTTVPRDGRLHDIGGYGIDITGDGLPDLVAGPRDLLAGDLIDLSLLAGGYIQYIPAANAFEPDRFTFQVVDDSGGPLSSRTDPTPNTMTFAIAAIDDAAVAQNDAVSTTEIAVGSGNLFADNGSGADSDVDGPALSVGAVNGVGANVGTQITLASGALLTVNADGTYDYDPNGAFDHLIDGATAAATGALNTSATDSFTYTLAGGGTATVTVTVNGVAGAGDELWGNGGGNTLLGTAVDDYFDLSQGGNDVVTGLDGNDAFYFGAAFTGADTVDGGAGDNDQIGLEGDYLLVLSARTLANVEVLAVLPGYDYTIIAPGGNVPAGGRLRVFAGNLQFGDTFHFEGSGETSGAFQVFGGLGTDLISTGEGNDGIYFGPDRYNPSTDRVMGGGGANDQFALDGDYTLTLDGAVIRDIEVITLLKGIPGDLADYNLTLADSLVGAGQTMTIWGCPVETSIVVDGSSESDGNLKIFGGTAGDTLIGGAGGDWFWGGLGADTLTGGAGADTFFYETAAESSAAGFDRLMSFDDTIDKIELDGHAVTGFAGPLSGALDGPTIGTQLEAAATTLGVDQALVFSVDGGGLNANTFLLIDGNDKAGYQAGGDFLILVSGAIGPVDNPGMFI